MLLPYSKFDVIFDELKGKSVFFRIGGGWIGDRLIDAAVRQLFKHYGIVETDIVRCDYLIESGGGDLGHGYDDSHKRRTHIFELAKFYNKKVIILPKSLYGSREELPSNLYKLYTRETISQSLVPGSILAPDCALSFSHFTATDQPLYDFGMFLREDENKFTPSNYKNNRGDPRSLIHSNIFELFDLASDYYTICTDRLHFAISAMLLGRKVILLPNSYYKNEGMYKTWLKDLGCSWSNNPGDFFEVITNRTFIEPTALKNLDYTVWNFGRTNGPLFGAVCLKSDGTIGLYNNKNEVRWRNNEDGSLDFMKLDGTVTTHFPANTKNGNTWIGDYNGLTGNHKIKRLKIRLSAEYF